MKLISQNKIKKLVKEKIFYKIIEIEVILKFLFCLCTSMADKLLV